MKHGPDIARLAALIGDPARANMLTALMAGKALTSSELAHESGIGAATASSHLAKLCDAGLVSATAQGRHRYWQLEADVAQVLENLMGLAARRQMLRTRPGPKSEALRKARLCYDHLAGEMGVEMFDALGRLGAIKIEGEEIGLGAQADVIFRRFGIEGEGMEVSGRKACRLCLDWSERRHHLAGRLGARLTQAIFDMGWAKREGITRVVRFSQSGEQAFAKALAD